METEQIYMNNGVNYERFYTNYTKSFKQTINCS